MRQDEYRKICKLSHSVFLYRSSDTSHQYTWETEEQPTKSGNLDWFLTKIHKNFISSYVTPEERSFSKKIVITQKIYFCLVNSSIILIRCMLL